QEAGSRRAAEERRSRGTEWQPGPAEQRLPVLMGTSGGNHGQCLDIGWHVTGTGEGSGTSATQTRKTVPRGGAFDGSAGPRTRLSPATCRRSGRRGWGHEGAIRTGPGSESPGAARTAEGAAVPPSTDPTCPYPQGCREDA